MRDQGDPAAKPLWTSGDMMFRISGPSPESDRLVKVSRPFALLGRSEDSDVVIPENAVSARHAYLHLDPRGVYAVDLVTRTGTRINGADQPVGWLQPGDSLEVGGRKIELLRIRIDGILVDPPPCRVNLLADNGRDDLPAVTLEPLRSTDPPWVLGSELVFLGWSAACGIQIKDKAASRTHCALVRSTRGAFLVDLHGRQTWVEDRLVQGAAQILDGDLITIGATQFTARVEAPSPVLESSAQLARIEHPAPGGYLTTIPNLSALDPSLVPLEAQNALLAWMMGTLQTGQGELMRRQGEFQNTITQILRQIQHESATLLNAHLERIENIDQELAAIRAEIERRNDPPYPPLPNVTPLRIARTTPKNLDPNRSEPIQASTHWLLNRAGQLEEENHSAWKDLLGRLSQSKRAT